MKDTPFIGKHLAAGARMAEFAGYNMPMVYTSIREEHLGVRSHAGIFDVSHMGEFILKGPAALELIQRLTSNDASVLTTGRVQYSCLVNERGGIVDDLLVYCLEKDKAYMLVVNASNIAKDFEWISGRNDKGADIHDISGRTCLLAVQGPLANRVLQPLTAIDLSALAYYTFAKGTFAGVENVLVSATGYTGAGGVEIYFEDADAGADKIWDAILREGAPQGLKPAGLGARDTLRLEMGYCLYGNDIDDHTTPLEAGLGWITKFKKDFIGKETLQKQKTEGIPRRLVGFEMTDRGIARHGYPVIDASGNTIGTVTSGTQSPSLGKAIGLAYVKTPFAAPDTPIRIRVRDKELAARVRELPFL